MKDAKLLTVLLITGVIVIAVYFFNPLHTATRDPFARVWGFKSFHVPTKSMEPTIKAGAFIVVSAWPYLRHEPRPGDIIAFRYPLNPETAYVKRVIAAGGSNVAIVAGATMVNDKPLFEPYARITSSSSYYYSRMPSVHVPPDCYFVMNDNRDVGTDSRLWGCVPRANIIGKLIQFDKAHVVVTQ